MTRANSSATAPRSGSGRSSVEVIAALDLGGRVAGELLGERAEVDDRVVRAEDDDHALGGLDQVAEGGLAPFLGQGEPLPFGDPRQAGAEDVGVDRLEDVVGRPLAQGGDRALEVGVAGHDDHGGVGAGGLEPGHELLGGRVGQPAVEDDRREPAQIVCAQRLGGAARRRDPVVVQLEDVAQVGPRVGIVLDHQDVERRRVVHGAHARALRRPPPSRPGQLLQRRRAAPGRRTACSRPRRPPRRATCATS